MSHIQPGKLQHNAYVERCIIERSEEAQEFATQWLWADSNERPNLGIGGTTPAQKLKMAA